MSPDESRYFCSLSSPQPFCFIIRKKNPTSNHNVPLIQQLILVVAVFCTEQLISVFSEWLICGENFLFPANEEMSCQLWLDTVETHLKKQNKTKRRSIYKMHIQKQSDAKMLCRDSGFVSETVCQLKTFDPALKERRVGWNLNLTCHGFNSDAEGLFSSHFLGGMVVGVHWPHAQIMTLTSVNSLLPEKWSVIITAVAGLHHPTDERLLCCPAAFVWTETFHRSISHYTEDVSCCYRWPPFASSCCTKRLQMYSSHSKSMSGLVSTIVMMKNGLENSRERRVGRCLIFEAALLDWKELNWNCVWDLIWMPLNLKYLACGKYGIIYAILIPSPTQVIHYSLTTCNRNQV